MGVKPKFSKSSHQEKDKIFLREIKTCLIV